MNRDRTLADKVGQSRTNARVALEAYRATGGQDDDDGACIGDLLTDLLHLADEVGTRYGDPLESGELLERAERDYSYERDPAHAGEGA